MIELADIHKTFNAGQPNEFKALRGIDLQLPAKALTLFCGPSGSGKTSLLAVIGGLSRPTRGRVRWQGRDVSGLPERFLAELRRRTFGFVFQQFHLIRGLSALDNVMLPAYPLGCDWRGLGERADALLERLKVAHRRAERVERLSGGEQQRVAIARALINAPQVVIADEPTAHLDSALANEFIGILSALIDEGKTVLVSSHDPRLVDSGLAQRLITLRDGRIIDDEARG